MTNLEPCPFCGGEAEMYEGRYSADGRDDRPWMVQCQQCGVMVSRMPEYGEYNYWWLHTTEGEAHMREKIVKAWSTRYKRTCKSSYCFETDEWQCLSCGGTLQSCAMFDPDVDGFVPVPKFCPNCGAEVIQ